MRASSTLCKVSQKMGHPELLPFIVAFCMFIFLFHSSPSPSEKQDERVNLSLYYETLCPSCADFITNHLVNVFNTDLQNIVNLRLVPWGNACLIDGKITCQHSKDECYLNTIDGCVINLWPDVLQLKYANETEHLNSPHEYVPWVVVNDKPIREDFQNFVTYVCQAYKGDHIPEVCKSQISSLNSDKKVNLIYPDCYS